MASTTRGVQCTSSPLLRCRASRARLVALTCALHLLLVLSSATPCVGRRLLLDEAQREHLVQSKAVAVSAATSNRPPSSATIPSPPPPPASNATSPKATSPSPKTAISAPSKASSPPPKATPPVNSSPPPKGMPASPPPKPISAPPPPKGMPTSPPPKAISASPPPRAIPSPPPTRASPPPPPKTQTSPLRKTPPSPPPKASPPPLKAPPAPPSPPPPSPALRTKTDTSTNTTVIDYEAYGWRAYGADGGNWSQIVHATFYGNDAGTNTYGACYGSTPTSISTQLMGVYNAAGSKVLLQEGAECGSCYQIKCSDPRLCITDSPVTVRLTNACPKSGGTGYPWCDFPRIHFDMSKPAFGSMVNFKVGAVMVRYRRVDCPVVGDVAYYISAKGNRWWIPINILNVGGPGALSAVWFRTSNTSAWIPLKRSWGANWPIHEKPYLVGRSVSFLLQLRSTQQYIVSENVLPANWTFGQTYVGGQYHAPDEYINNDLVSAATTSTSDVSTSDASS